ncbi:PIG-L family deacetylase [Zhouia sp. PK063]|uniref:PIG-L family deacetylase n=1 Tax=Zhouia sp. PK063 TaxID=3373602 RepID=UPI0037B3EB62
MRQTYTFLSILCILFFSTSYSQQPKKLTSNEIFEHIEQLNFLGSVLYVGAHPDDENTQLISYFANEVHARTAYLSLTRGDGGQNLIGPELRELLGVLRTEELLDARKIDGGEQLFSRANDFGFSKNPDETLKIWNKNEVLADVIRAIRTFKPDVIINRFDHRTPGTTHGHHTASAMLSVEAFDFVNDKNAYPEQLKTLNTWQPKRLFFNTSWWFYGSEEKFKEANKGNFIKLNTGNFYPLKGLSNSEIAAISRSQHLCQGMGRLTSRGVETEYLELLKGEKINTNTVFDGINTTWTRVTNGKKIGEILTNIQKNFNFQDPSIHVADLLQAYQLIQQLPEKDVYWKVLKTKQIKQIITACAGLFLDADASEASTVPGADFNVNLEAINRSNTTIVLKSITANPENKTQNLNLDLDNNKDQKFSISTKTNVNQEYTSPYWLWKKGTLGMYNAPEKFINLPETPRAATINFNLLINDVPITITRNVVYKYANPAKGEVYEPFNVLPKITASIANKVNIFDDGNAKTIPVEVRAGENNISGDISLKVPEGWTVIPATQHFEIKQKGDKHAVLFSVTPPKTESTGVIKPIITSNGKTYNFELVTIDYPHIPKQSVLLPSEAKVVRLNIEKAGQNIAYIMGAGDVVPQSLQQIGYRVQVIDPNNIQENSLDKFDAVVIGIRAYNVLDILHFKQHYLLDYVKKGGTMIVQYNTAGRNNEKLRGIAPYNIDFSTDRVTDENAKVTFLAKNNALLNFPNKITENDFEGWVQERGLYFPRTWDTRFTPILSMHDKDESAKNGSLLIAPYGKGYYIYTGLSFFRELPAGVPGAYKLFANMLSVGKSTIKTSNIKQ